jgi:hypothetical protein
MVRGILRYFRRLSYVHLKNHVMALKILGNYQSQTYRVTGQGKEIFRARDDG